MILPVIMAGGAGSRLWPLSRTLYPKQFLSLTSANTMLQETVERLFDIEHRDPFFICNEEHRFIVAEQLRKNNLAHSGIVLEPEGRNTAPAIALAAIQQLTQGEDPLLLVLAADHVIQNQDAFTDAVLSAVPLAQQGKLVTFGVVPTAPETGYGYIQKGDKIDHTDSYQVKRFVEKPDLDTAKVYLETGDFLWNSGMFLFKASRYVEELEKFNQDMLIACQEAMSGSHADLDFIRLDEESFKRCPSDSIDYTVMENTQDAVVVPMNAKWSDVGSFSALWEVNSKDHFGNAIRGDVLTEQTSNSFIYSQDRLVSTVGVSNLVVVETKDAVLVAHKDKVQDVKSIVNQLNRSNRIESIQHREVYQPWGSHDEIASGDRFLVKHLVVKPGEKTALQMHHHRAEHWVVVQGAAKVTNDQRSYLVGENESTYIPVGVAHRIENPGKVDLHLIEVRSGSYLEEDDIVRLEEYGAGY